jgi:hypothetical protein
VNNKNLVTVLLLTVIVRFTKEMLYDLAIVVTDCSYLETHDYDPNSRYIFSMTTLHIYTSLS